MLMDRPTSAASKQLPAPAQKNEGIEFHDNYFFYVQFLYHFLLFQTPPLSTIITLKILGKCWVIFIFLEVNMFVFFEYCP